MKKILTLTVVAVVGVFIFLLSCETKGMSSVPEQPPGASVPLPREYKPYEEN